jgi:hypothetical protein
VLDAEAANWAVALPANTCTEAGTCTEALFEDSATSVAVPAFALSVTVQETLPPGDTVVAPQVTEERVAAAGSSTRATSFDTPLYAAVTTASVFAETKAPVAVNPATLLPAGTVTDSGTVSCDTLDDSAMLAPPAGAALDSTTPHTVVVAPVKVAGLHDRTVIVGPVGAGATVTVAVRVAPAYEADTVADEVVVTVPGVAVKVADVLPAGTLTLAGTVS